MIYQDSNIDESIGNHAIATFVIIDVQNTKLNSSYLARFRKISFLKLNGTLIELLNAKQEKGRKRY